MENNKSTLDLFLKKCEALYIYVAIPVCNSKTWKYLLHYVTDNKNITADIVITKAVHDK